MRGRGTVVVFAGAVCLVAVLASLLAIKATLAPGLLPELFSASPSDVAFICTALVLAGSALATALTSPTVGTAVAAGTLTGAWCALAGALWADAAAVRFFATIVAGLLPAALLHVSSALARAGSHGRVEWLPPTAYAAMAALGVTRVLVTDPILDPACIVGCARTTWFAVAAPEASRVLGLVLLWTWGTTAALAGTWAMAALIRGLVRRSAPALWAVVACAVAELAWVALPATRPITGPPLWEHPWLFELRAVTYIALALALTADAAHRAASRRGIRRLASALVAATPPQRLRDALAAAARDPQLRIAFRLAHGWVDDLGRPVSWPDDAAASAVKIQRAGDPVATISLARTDLDTADIETLLGPAALLALDIERMRAESLSRLAQLRDSRQRVVEAADTARRTAERDVHDGAQQSLIAGSFELLLAAEDARAAGELGRAECLDLLRTDLLEALAALRAVAQGLYPPVLADAGLVAGLESFARLAEVPISVTAPAIGRLHPALEHTAYLTATEPTQGASGPVAVTISHAGDVLVVSVTGPGLGQPTPELADRAAALGGTLEAASGRVRLEVPCASS